MGRPISSVVLSKVWEAGSLVFHLILINISALYSLCACSVGSPHRHVGKSDNKQLSSDQKYRTSCETGYRRREEGDSSGKEGKEDGRKGGRREEGTLTLSVREVLDGLGCHSRSPGP